MLKQRNTNLDLLKMICIFMVLILHYFNPQFGSGGGSILSSKVTFSLCEALSIVAVDVFIIITGYFSISKNEIKIYKIINLLLIMIFYGVVIYLGCLIIKIEQFNLKNLIIFAKTAFSRWFIIIYIILYLLSPYINKLFNSISKENNMKLILICIFFFYIWPTFFTSITCKDSGYGIINFITLYLIGGFIRKYYDSFSDKRIIVIYFIMTLITTIFSYFTFRAWNYNSIFNLISAVSLFLFFKSLKLKENKLINYLATFTLSIYIIHENEFICKRIYQGIFKTLKYKNSLLLIPHLFFTCICIFIGCVIIELIRRKLFAPLINKLLLKIPFFNKEFTIN